jgi:Zn-dependent protease
MKMNNLLQNRLNLVLIVICLVFVAQKVIADPRYASFSLLAIVIAVTVHECAHAWSADALGDPTARLLGRKTLNPLSHLDPIGSLLFVAVGFGWGKPVPVDPFNLRDEHKDHALISLAGPASNLLVAALVGVIYRFVPVSNDLFAYFLQVLAGVNVSLAVFNLLPIPPLDGSKIYRAVLPKSFLPLWQFLDEFGVYILLFMFITGNSIFGNLLRPIVSNIMNLLGF